MNEIIAICLPRHLSHLLCRKWLGTPKCVSRELIRHENVFEVFCIHAPQNEPNRNNDNNKQRHKKSTKIKKKRRKPHKSRKSKTHQPKSEKYAPNRIWFAKSYISCSSQRLLQSQSSLFNFFGCWLSLRFFYFFFFFVYVFAFWLFVAPSIFAREEFDRVELALAHSSDIWQCTADQLIKHRPKHDEWLACAPFILAPISDKQIDWSRFLHS